MRGNSRHIFFLLGLLILAFFANVLMAGSSVLNFTDFSFNNYIFTNIRFTKALTAVLCGICLPLAGQILQVLFRNPLAGPYVLGISSSASLFVGVVIMLLNSFGLMGHLFFSKSAIVIAAFSGSLLSTFVILLVAKKINSNVFLLLIGLMLGQIFGAMQSFIEYFSSDKSLREFVMWGFGSLGSSNYTDLMIFFSITLVLVLLLFSFTKPFQVFLLGENYTNALGIDFKSTAFISLSSRRY